MRRNNMMQQFSGDPDPLSEGVNAEEVGYEEVKFDIKGGTISLVVPPGTPDDQVWNDPRACLIVIETEDGQTFQFEVNQDGTGSVVV